MRQELLIHLLCLIVAAGALGVAVWVVLGGQIGEQGIDALFLVAVALMTAFAFAAIPATAARKGALRDLLPRRKTAAKETSAAAAQMQERS